MSKFSFTALTRTLLPLAITAVLSSPAWSEDVYTVKDLSTRTTEKQVRALFEPYGEVLSIEFKQAKHQGHNSGPRKKTAQVTVKSGKDASGTAKRLNRRTLDGSKIIVTISRDPDRQDISRDPDRQDISRDPDRQDISRDPDRQD